MFDGHRTKVVRHMSNKQQADFAETDIVAVLHALSDPVRLDIVRQIADAPGEKICGDFKLPVSKSTGSHHFKILLKAGVISERAQGTCKYISLRRSEMQAQFPGLLDSILHAAGEKAH
jgi:DNA-binding transcriptional ArsR family regulator